MHQEPFSSIEDFIFNPSFRSWILDNDGVHKEYWENWIAENPDKVPVLNYAKAIVYALTINHKQLSEGEVDNEIKQIIRQTNTPKRIEEKTKDSPGLEKPMNPAYKKLAIAASIITIAVFSIFYVRLRSPAKRNQAHVNELSSLNSSSIIDQSNNSDSVQLMTLFDGSTVRLHPKSKLSVSHGSFSKKREVYLVGEAFFDVKKNPSVPFVVYTKHIVTKVLGTTFDVVAYPHEKNASVKVGTGKVSVYRKGNFSDKDAVANALNGIIIIPNQQAIYETVSQQLRKTIIDEPIPLSANPPETFVFHSVPLKEILKKLQDTYGITIICDESVTSSCLLSVSLQNKNFYDKLELICQAINASYESVDGTIFISSQGCK